MLIYKLVDFGDQSRRVWSPNSTSLVFKAVRTILQDSLYYIAKLLESHYNKCHFVGKQRHFVSGEEMGTLFE